MTSIRAPTITDTIVVLTLFSLSFAFTFTAQTLIHSSRSLLLCFVTEDPNHTSLFLRFAFYWVREMAAIAVHQISQSITCHAWSPDQSSNSEIYPDFSCFFFLITFSCLDAEKIPLRGCLWLWFTETECNFFVLRFCEIWWDWIYLVIRSDFLWNQTMHVITGTYFMVGWISCDL